MFLFLKVLFQFSSKQENIIIFDNLLKKLSLIPHQINSDRQSIYSQIIKNSINKKKYLILIFLIIILKIKMYYKLYNNIEFRSIDNNSNAQIRLLDILLLELINSNHFYSEYKKWKTARLTNENESKIQIDLDFYQENYSTMYLKIPFEISKKSIKLIHKSQTNEYCESLLINMYNSSSLESFCFENRIKKDIIQLDIYNTYWKMHLNLMNIKNNYSKSSIKF